MEVITLALFALPSLRGPLVTNQILGNMAIAMTQLAITRSLPAKIGQLVLFYPVTNTHTKSATYQEFKDGPYLTEKTMDWMIGAFLPTVADRSSALASPLEFAPDEVLAKFPPTTIFVSGADPLIGEGQAFGQRLQKLGVDAATFKAEGCIHDFVLLEPIRNTATPRAVTEFASFKLLKAFADK